MIEGHRLGRNFVRGVRCISCACGPVSKVRVVQVEQKTRLVAKETRQWHKAVISTLKVRVAPVLEVLGAKLKKWCVGKGCRDLSGTVAAVCLLAFTLL